MWHRFNLTYFETEVQKGITQAQNAEQAAAPITTPAPIETPGFELILFISAILLLLKKKGLK